MKRLFIWIFFFLPLLSSAQVINNDINRRLPLLPNTPLISNTTKCTVQWNCVDAKAVTGCILFHNDQWFEFTTRQAGAYYITLTNQNCRDIRGVQVLVIDGEPCKPATYRHLICYSTGTQDDISITLDSLQANHTYLVNIDGYLNDFCKFEITLRTQIPDFAIFPLPAYPTVNAQLQDKVVLLQWTLSDSLTEELTEFYILRRHNTDKKSSEIIRFPAVTNTFGNRQKAYLQYDTLAKEGMYSYRIIGSTSQRRNYLLKELSVNFNPLQQTATRPEDILLVEIPVRKKLNVGIYIMDAQTENVLKKAFMMTSSKNKNLVRVDVSNFRKAGIHQFKVLIKELDKTNGYEKSLFFSR